MFAFNENLSVVANASILINRTPEDIFHFIGERFFINYPRWSPEVLELRQIGAGPVGVGTHGRQIRMDLGHRSESIFAVTVFEPDRKVCFRGVSSPYRCDYELTKLGSTSSTEIRFTFELAKLETYLRPFAPLIRDVIEAGVERTVRNLKRLIESEAKPQIQHIALDAAPGRIFGLGSNRGCRPLKASPVHPEPRI